MQTSKPTMILVVDDNDPVRYATSRFVRGAGFQVVEAADGATALEQVQNAKPDLVVLDVNLPDINGYEVCRRIKSNAATKLIPVLHLSATYTDGSAKVTGLDGGADAYLAQPVSPDELMATIRALLRIRRAEEEARRQASEAIAARHELEQVLAALWEKNHTLQALIQASPLAIMAIDQQGNITAWNAAAEKIFGWAASEAIGRPLGTIPADSPDLGRSEMSAAGGTAAVAVETVRQRKDGTSIPVSLSAAPLCDAEGRAQGAIIVISDDTERKKAEEGLRRHERLVSMGRMASILAHEINNPLSSVLNIVYLLRQRTDLDASAKNYLEMAEAELTRITEITRQMLAIHREAPKPVRFKVAELLDSALSLFGPTVREKEAELIKDYDDSGELVSSPGELRQVFANIIGNALEAVGKGGVVKVRARETKNGVCVIIADNGPGMTPEVRSHIFEPFFTTKGEKGTGLGLWVAQSLVHKHKGTMRMRSTTAAKRHGTTFSCFFSKLRPG